MELQQPSNKIDFNKRYEKCLEDLKFIKEKLKQQKKMEETQ